MPITMAWRTLHVVKRLVPGVNPQAEITPGGADNGDNLVVVHVGLILAPVTDPVPVGLVGQLGGLLRGLVQDSEDNQLVHVRQFGDEVVGVLVKVLFVNPHRLAFGPLIGANAHGDILEHGLLTARLEPGLVKNDPPAIR